MAGVIIPKSRQGNAVAAPQGRLTVQAEENGLGFVAQGANQLSGDIEKIGLAEKLITDKARVTESLALAQSEYQKSLFADGGPLRRRGGDVMEREGRPSALDAGLSTRRDVLEKYLGTLDNDTQRTAMREAWASRERFSVDTLTRHQLGEQEKYTDQVDSAFLESTSEAIVGAGSDEEVTVLSGEIASKVLEMGRRKGWDPEVIRNTTDRAVSAPLEARVRSLADSDAAAAQAALDTYGDRILPSKRGALESLVATESKAQQGQAGAAAAMAQDLTREEARAWVQERFSGELEDEVLTRVEREYTVREAAKARAQADFQIQAGARTQELYANGALADPAKARAEREKIRLGAREAELSPAETNALLRTHDTLAAGQEIQTDFAFFDTMKTDLDLASKQSEAVLRSRLSDTEYKDLAKDIRAYKLGEIPGGEILTEEINTTFDQHGWTSASDRQVMGEMRAGIMADMRAALKDGPVTPERRQRIIDTRMGMFSTSRLPWARGLRTDEDELTALKAQSPHFVAYAAYQASGQASRLPTPREALAEVRRLQERQRKLELAGDNEALNAFTKKVEAAGREAAKQIYRAGLDPDDIYGGGGLIAREADNAKADDVVKEEAKPRSQRKRFAGDADG